MRGLHGKGQGTTGARMVWGSRKTKYKNAFAKPVTVCQFKQMYNYCLELYAFIHLV